ncbi:MAG: hypothetical protein D6798_13255 [Deltaproteobacteria bacterium]|nr:MAG: hypothetical protein D6798_13255 [Deltaproteobacteria bacterium]
MPDYDLKQAPTTSTSTPTTTTPAPTSESAQDQFGNDFVKQQVQTLPSGKLTYEQALGEMLGGALYKQLEKQLTDEKLVGHAQKAVDSALGKLRDYLNDQVEPDQQKAANLFVNALKVELHEIARKAVIDTGAAEGAREWVDEHPYAIATAAVAGAVAYVLSNQDLPLIEQKVGLGGGHALLAGIDIGRTMDLALEQVRVGYKYTGGGTRAQLTGDIYQDGWAVNGMFQQTLDPGETVRLSGQHLDRGDQQKSRLDLSYRNPNLAASAYWERMYGAGVDGSNLDAYGGSISNVPHESDDIKAYLRGEYRTDGSYTGAAGVSRNQGNWDWSVEGYTGQTATGSNDSGIRAMLNWRF